MCQCPERGDLHFYADPLYEIHTGSMCQCPERGDLHFYIKKAGYKKIVADCGVNALKGATFISTIQNKTKKR